MDIRPMVGATHCVICGRPLPKGRTKKCYICRPKRSYADEATAYRMPQPEYNFAERGAQADARGISYGQLMILLEAGQPLPPLKKSVVWPFGSKHAGEEQLPEK